MLTADTELYSANSYFTAVVAVVAVWFNKSLTKNKKNYSQSKVTSVVPTEVTKIASLARERFFVMRLLFLCSDRRRHVTEKPPGNEVKQSRLHSWKNKSVSHIFSPKFSSQDGHSSRSG